MNKRIATFAIVAAMVVAGGLAAFQSRTGSSSTTPQEFGPSEIGPSTANAPQAPELPPNHPPIGTPNPGHPSFSAPPDETAAIVWVAPPNWRSAASPSPMRLATYRIPRAPGDDEDAELSVTRAGGSAEANIQRWIGQFDGSSTSSREEKTVLGFKASLVSVKGTFLGGGMMQGTPPSPRASWALLGAIVETPGSSYFFKLVGPAATVNAARAPFKAMIEGLKRP
jgi:hypothetical protein